MSTDSRELNLKAELGIILSGATTSEASFQPFAEAERGAIREGMLVLVKMSRPRSQILSRISGIIPHNAFFSEGDGFTEARRRRMPVPSEVARQYETCKLELLMRLPQTSGYEVTVPPHPGDLVVRYDPTQNEEAIFGKKRGAPGLVWYGSLSGYSDAPIPLDIEKVPMHMAVFGVTGSGKSYNMGSLIECLSEIPCQRDGNRSGIISYPMVIIDANGDYTDYVEKKEPLGAFGRITRFVFPAIYRRMQRQRRVIDNVQPIGVSLNDLDSRELAEAIIQFYKGGSIEGSELQVNALQTALQEKVDSGLNHQLLLTTSYTDLRSAITGHVGTVGAAQRALDKFRSIIENQHHLLSEQNSPLVNKRAFIETLTSCGGIAVFDFSADGATGVDLPTKQFIISYLAAIFFEEFTRFKLEGAERYMIFVLEEAQNFCPDLTYPVGSSLAKTKLSAIATQGRKFGLSLCLISQRPAFVDRIVLSMCNTFFIHRVSPEDIRFVNSVTGGLAPSVAPRLTRLDQGEIVVTGQMNLVPFSLLVRGPSKRRVDHKAGKTEVLKGLLARRGG